jgi:small neutral amino acid transporter SnatA (MarC family)
MSLDTLTVGLLAMSDPVGLPSVVGQAGPGTISLEVAESPASWSGRLMGLLITAVAVQILVNGLQGCFPIMA